MVEEFQISLEDLERVSPKLFIESDRVRAKIKNRTFLPLEKLPLKGSSELASLVGHSFGDGHIENGAFSFTNKCEELIQEVIGDVNKIGFKNVTINKRIHKAKIIRFSKIVREVLILAGAPIGNKVTQKFQLPDWIKSNAIDSRKYFIRALFDDEGSVKPKSHEITLKFAKIEKLQYNMIEFLNEIKSILKEFDIEGVTITKDLVHEGKNGKTIQRVLRICGIKSFINFQKSIGFSHPKKSRLLQDMINNTQKIKLRKYEGQTKIMDILNRMNATTNQLSGLIGITPLAAWKHLIKLEKKNLIYRIRPKKVSECHIWLIKNDKNNFSDFW